MLSERLHPTASASSEQTTLDAAGANANALMRRLLLLVFALIVVAIGLRELALVDSDVPDLNVLRRDAREIYLPALAADSNATSAIVHDHAWGERAWKLFWLRANGFIDARVLGLAGVVAWAAALSALLFALSRAVGWRVALVLGIAASAALLTPGWRGLDPSESVPWCAGVVFFSCLHLALMARRDARDWRWWLGLLAGIANVVLATAGIASAASLVAWAWLARSRRVDEVKPSRATLAANAVLFAGGLALAIARGAPPDQAAPFLGRLFSLTAWPLHQSIWAVLIWAPAIACAAQWLLRRTREARDSAIALLALWAIAQILALAAIGASDRASSAGILLAALVVNAACFASLSARDAAARSRRFAFASVWLLAVAVALLNPRTDWENILFGAPEKPVELMTSGLREAALGKGADALREMPGLDAAGAEDLAALLKIDAFRAILPQSTWPALPLAADHAAGEAAAFSADGSPEMPGLLEGLATLGSRAPGADVDAGRATGEFVSAPLETRFPILQVRVAGDLRPPETSLVLRGADGVEVAPLESNFTATARWKSVNFPAPKGPFQLVARDQSATSWLAFSAPVEVANASRIIRRIARCWLWFALAGVAAGGFLVFAGLRADRRARATAGTIARSREPFVQWSLVPWALLFGYALYFGGQIDTTAGPNDSGGYLNSAKLIAHGHIVATPRMIDGSAAGETSILPYIPATFVPTRGEKIAPTYPVGLPIIFAAVAQVVGLARAVPLVILVQLLLGVLLTRSVARLFGLPNGWAWLAGGLVGMSPLYFFQGLQPLSDSPAMVWVTGAVILAWKSREKAWLAVPAGLVTAMAVLVRPTNVLCVLPVFLCLAGRWKQAALWIAAGIPGAIFQMWYNHELYGNAFLTGYGDVRSMFGLPILAPTLLHYVQWLPAFLTPLVWLALAGPFLPSVPRLVRIVLASWAGLFLGFYALYTCTHDSWFNVRFVLPAFPALAVLMLHVVRRGLARFRIVLFDDAPIGPRGIFSSTAVVLTLAALLVATTVDLRALFWVHANRQHAVAARWVSEHVPEDAVIFANFGTGPLMFYSDRVVVNFDPNRPGRTPEFYDRVNHTSRPIYAITYDWEGRGYVPGTHGDGYPTPPGTWTRVASLWNNDVFVWKRVSASEPEVAAK